MKEINIIKFSNYAITIFLCTCRWWSWTVLHRRNLYFLKSNVSYMNHRFLGPFHTPSVVPFKIIALQMGLASWWFHHQSNKHLGTNRWAKYCCWNRSMSMCTILLPMHMWWFGIWPSYLSYTSRWSWKFHKYITWITLFDNFSEVNFK